MLSRYKVRVIYAFTDPATVKQWDALAAMLPFGWFQTSQWVLSWWNTFGHDKSPFVLGVYVESELIAILPWCVFGDTMQCMGDPLNDLNQIAIHPNHNSQAVLQAVFLAIKRHLPMLVKKIALECWPRPLPALEHSGIIVDEQPLIARPILHLSANAPPYPDALNVAHRRRLLQTIRRLRRRVPQVALNITTDGQAAREICTAMLAMREQSLKSRGYLPACEPASRAQPFGKLLENLLNYPTTAKHIIVGALISDGQILAAGLYFRWQSILFKYMQGWALHYRDWSPGTVLDVEMIRYAQTSGIQTIDFGRGEEPYKSRLGAETHWMYNYTLTTLMSA